MDAPKVFRESSHAPEKFQISIIERLAAYLALLALVGGAAGALAAWPGPNKFTLSGLSIAAGVVLAAVCIIFLSYRWRNQYVVRERHLLMDKTRRVSDEKRELEGYLYKITQHRQVMDSERRAQIESLKPTYREISADLNALFLSIDQRERDELDAALEAYQEAFVRTTIADASIRRVRVPGFTTRVLERLEEAGILTAVDVTTERLKSIPNLDPFLIQELDLWRQRIERSAQERIPLHLPQARLDLIHARYQEERMAVRASMEGLVIGMQGEVFKIEDRIDERVVQSNAMVENLGTRVSHLGELNATLFDRIRPLHTFTFWRYLLACLFGSR